MSLELAGLLVTSGAVPLSMIDDALRHQVLAGGAFDTALLESSSVPSEAELLRFLERLSGLPGIDREELGHADPSVAGLLPARLAERHCLLPLRTEGKALHVAVPFPVSEGMLQEIGALLDMELKARVALEVRLREAIARVYQIPLAPRYATLLAMLGPAPALPPTGPAAEPPADLPLDDSSAPPESPAAGAEELPDVLLDEADEEKPRATDEEKPPPAALALLTLKKDDDGLHAALERVLEEAERNPKLLLRRAAPRDHVDAEGIADRIAQSSGIPAPVPAERWTFGEARSALEGAEDRHAIIAVALRFALKTFDFSAAFAVVGGNAVGWTALTAQGYSPERVERVSLPLDAPSMLRTVLYTRGRYLGPVPSDPISRQLVSSMDRPAPSVALVVPIEVRERPVAILYADAFSPVSEKKVSELLELVQLVGRRLERLILDSKKRLAASTQAEPSREPPGDAVAAAAKPAEAPGEPAPPSPPVGTAAELFARSPAHAGRPTGPISGRPELPSLSPMRAPGVSRLQLSVPGSVLPAMDELFSAADKLVGTDLSARAEALGILSRVPDVAAAVLSSRFPGPVLRARVHVTELPAADELGPIPGAMAKMGPAAARSLAPLLDHRDTDVRYFAVLTAGRVPSPLLVGPIAARVFDHQAMVANAARVALGGMRQVPGFAEALARLRAGLGSREVTTVICAARALAPLHDLEAIPKLIELCDRGERGVAQAAADALREITKQTLGAHSDRWKAWWLKSGSLPRTAWLVEALEHRDLDLRISAIDELVRVANDSFGYFADAPKSQRDEAVERWRKWLAGPGRTTPVE